MESEGLKGQGQANQPNAGSEILQKLEMENKSGQTMDSGILLDDNQQIPSCQRYMVQRKNCKNTTSSFSIKAT